MAHRTRTLSFTAVAATLVAAPLLVGTGFAQMAGQSADQPQGGMPQSTTGQTNLGQTNMGQGNIGESANGTTPEAPGGMGRSMAATNVSHSTIAKAGKAMHNVLAINQSYGKQLSATTDPATKQQIVATAKQKAMIAIKNQGLSVGQYNQVLAAAEQNPALRQQLLSSAGVTAKN